MWRSTKRTNSAYKYTNVCPSGNHPGTLKVTQSVNKSHGPLDGRSRVLCNARKRIQDTYRKREGAWLGVSGMAAKYAEFTCAMILNSAL